MSEGAQEQRAVSRVIRFLQRGPAECLDAAIDGRILLQAAERGTISAAAGVLKRMLDGGLLLRDGRQVSLTGEGDILARHLATVSEAFADQHREIDVVAMETPASQAFAAVNLAESPLAQLARRKTKDGKSYLSAAELTAGERLRADYTRGQIMPRLCANWEASVASGRRDGGYGGLAELTDAALAARQRVERALVAVGPELSGVLIDICCFLKGLEVVEAERGWPARSAKIVLKSALGVLSRHYSPVAALRHRIPLHWGAADYRPNIG